MSRTLIGRKEPIGHDGDYGCKLTIAILIFAYLCADGESDETKPALGRRKRPAAGPRKEQAAWILA